MALVEDGATIIANLISSQVALHEKFGGVVPELASRKHLEVVNPLVDEALKSSGLAWRHLGGIGVSHGPGLIGSLLVGVATAKAMAGLLGIPLVGVNHLAGHVYANFLVNPSLPLPCLCLLVSGGHTALVIMREHGRFELLGETRDDAAGECFDKSARILGLPYPGGPEIDRRARSGDHRAIKFPRAFLEEDSLEFSFSGLKTAVKYFVKNTPPGHHSMEDVCASLQHAIVDVLVRKSLLALEQTGIRRLMLAGGVACNSSLSARLGEESRRRNFELSIPPPVLCTDNAAMVACAAWYDFKRGREWSLFLDANPNLTWDDIQ
ncbi:MAG: tRNA (adenosine(37)-N6)-threonylcarbamoyltransferase complex transferase subunit TsaD [Candidatus Eremiobacteraeota bacterium]|nr:tRNA (adenosine(37)-N6)-threonylcarbamoyltransferase complex transferase subunit TsaD [Candidatus Eremiobacteraeota bacterium]